MWNSLTKLFTLYITPKKLISFQRLLLIALFQPGDFIWGLSKDSNINLRSTFFFWSSHRFLKRRASVWFKYLQYSAACFNIEYLEMARLDCSKARRGRRDFKFKNCPKVEIFYQKSSKLAIFIIWKMLKWISEFINSVQFFIISPFFLLGVYRNEQNSEFIIFAQNSVYASNNSTRLW